MQRPQNLPPSTITNVSLSDSPNSSRQRSQEANRTTGCTDWAPLTAPPLPLPAAAFSSSGSSAFPDPSWAPLSCPQLLPPLPYPLYLPTCSTLQNPVVHSAHEGDSNLRYAQLSLPNTHTGGSPSGLISVGSSSLLRKPCLPREDRLRLQWGELFQFIQGNC